MRKQTASPGNSTFNKISASGRWVEAVLLLTLLLFLPCCTTKVTDTIPTTANPPGEITATRTIPIISTHTSTAVFSSPDPSETMPPVSSTPSPTTQAPVPDFSESDLLRQGAAYGFLDPYQVDEVAVGMYHSDAPECGNGWLATLPEEAGDTVLTLQYATPLLAGQIEIYAGEKPVDIRRVELLNANSGLGKTLDITADGSWESIPGEPCPQRLILPVNADFEVDTVIIEFGNLSSAAKVAAVEMAGRFDAYVEAPVFWRVPLPATPADIAMGLDGTVFVATKPNGLYAYDVEGNLLKQFSVPIEADLTSLETDPFGNLIVTDAAYGWFIVLSPAGDQLAVGGNDSFYKTTINPQDGNLYLLSDNALQVYTTDTAELIRKMPLDDWRQYSALAFDPNGRLYLLRDYEWDATLATIDPLTGEELDAIPLDNSTVNEIVVRDFTFDEAGNIYILYIVNTGQIAIHKLDPQGRLLQRFGVLSRDLEDRPEGSFIDPRAITVSPDGRFVLVADGYDEQSYLTAFLMEIDE